VCQAECGLCGLSSGRVVELSTWSGGLTVCQQVFHGGAGSREVEVEVQPGPGPFDSVPSPVKLD